MAKNTSVVMSIVNVSPDTYVICNKLTTLLEDVWKIYRVKYQHGCQYLQKKLEEGCK